MCERSEHPFDMDHWDIVQYFAVQFASTLVILSKSHSEEVGTQAACRMVALGSSRMEVIARAECCMCASYTWEHGSPCLCCMLHDHKRHFQQADHQMLFEASLLLAALQRLVWHRDKMQNLRHRRVLVLGAMKP